MTLSAQTQTFINEHMEAALSEGRSITNYAQRLTQQQLGRLCDYIFDKKISKDTASVDRSLSKSLCCFLYVLHREGRPTHYSKIRDIVKSEFEHMTNDYSTLAFWRLIEKSNTGLGHWKITQRGEAFLNGKLSISRVVTIKNNKVIGGSTSKVFITDFEGFKYISYNPAVADFDEISII